MKQHVFLCILMVGLAFYGCSKDNAPTETPLVPGTSTIITGTVKDSTGNPIDSTAIKVKYYFTAVAKQSAKTDPCSLVSFTAYRITNGVQLNWTTEGENSAFQWEIQRSGPSDTDFIAIGVVNASGTTSSTINYTYVDSTAAADSADYYRLCLIDNIGARYFYGPVGLGPVPTLIDRLDPAYPCPFDKQYASMEIMIACTSYVSLRIMKNNFVLRSFFNQNVVGSIGKVSWNGTDSNGIYLQSGYYMSTLEILRHDSVMQYKRPFFINVFDSSSLRINTYTDLQGSFSLNDIPLDSVFNMRDVLENDLGNVKVCDSVTVYAVKSGYTVKKVTLVLGKNTTSTINFVLR